MYQYVRAFIIEYVYVVCIYGQKQHYFKPYVYCNIYLFGFIYVGSVRVIILALAFYLISFYKCLLNIYLLFVCVCDLNI